MDKLNSSTAEKSEDVRPFATELIAQLACFTSHEAGQYTINWCQYHKYRCTPCFREMWVKFVSDITEKIPHPTFYQSITQQIIKFLVEKRYHHATTSSATAIAQRDSTRLSAEEQNALRYPFGYIIRKAQNSLEKVKGKEDMIFCLQC